MKKILLILLPISLFVFSCEINDAGGDTIINSNEGVQLKWIGQDGSQGSIFYKSSIPSVPSNWDIQLISIIIGYRMFGNFNMNV